MRSFMEMRAALAERVAAWPGVEGLVWAGSTADTDRADEWSDLDFFLIVASGLQESFRTDLSWLPDPERLVLTPRETAHGCKALYDDGLVCEFAVFDRDELSAAVVNHHGVAFGDDDIAHRVAAIHRADAYPDHATAEERLALAATTLVIALGRHRRGEVLIAGQGIRSYAVGHVLAAAHGLLASEAPAARDGLDAWRRVEQEYPGLAADLAAAVALDNEAAARALLLAMQRWFGDHSDVPARGAEVLLRRFGV